LQVLREVNRVLRPGGIFVFSSHNRNIGVYPAWHRVNLKLSKNPIRLVKNIAKYFLGILFSAKLTGHEVQTEEYAIRNDQAQGYQLLTYYISLDQQVAQLQQSGFVVELCIGVNGEVLEKDNSYAGGYSIYYVARTR
jgi:SAM-dependent methyltransferase